MKKGLENEVNIVVVGDHGMAATSIEEVVLVDDYIDLEEVYITDLGPIGLFNVKDSTRVESMLADLNKMPHARWFKRDHLPAELHYSGSTRISGSRWHCGRWMANGYQVAIWKVTQIFTRAETTDMNHGINQCIPSSLRMVHSSSRA